MTHHVSFGVLWFGVWTGNKAIVCLFTNVKTNLRLHRTFCVHSTTKPWLCIIFHFLCGQNVPYQPHLRSPSPPASVTRGDPKLSGLTAIDSRSRRHRPGRQVSSATTTGPARSVSSGNDYSIRPMRAGDLLVVADLMKKEGWNVDFDNMAQVYTMQPHNFFVAHTASGEIVGKFAAVFACAAWAYFQRVKTDMEWSMSHAWYRPMIVVMKMQCKVM